MNIKAGLNLYRKVIVVTGANRGVGYGIIELFCRDKKEFLQDRIFVLTSRKSDEGIKAVDKLIYEYPEIKNNLCYFQLDITHGKGVQHFKKEILKEFGHINILYNNAAILPRVESHDLHTRDKILTDTFNTNVFGLINFTEQMLPIIKNGGHIINMSSSLGKMKFSKSNIERFMNENLTIDDLHKYYHEYRQAFIHNKIENSEWELDVDGKMNTKAYAAYPMSKVFVNAYTRILSKRLKRIDINVKVNSVTPGWVSTNIGGPGATRSYLHGAETPFWMASFPEERVDELSGNFYNHDRSITTWI